MCSKSGSNADAQVASENTSGEDNSSQSIPDASVTSEWSVVSAADEGSNEVNAKLAVEDAKEEKELNYTPEELEKLRFDRD